MLRPICRQSSAQVGQRDEHPSACVEEQDSFAGKPHLDLPRWVGGKVTASVAMWAQGPPATEATPRVPPARLVPTAHLLVSSQPGHAAQWLLFLLASKPPTPSQRLTARRWLHGRPLRAPSARGPRFASSRRSHLLECRGPPSAHAHRRKTVTRELWPRSRWGR